MFNLKMDPLFLLRLQMAFLTRNSPYFLADMFGKIVTFCPQFLSVRLQLQIYIIYLSTQLQYSFISRVNSKCAELGMYLMCTAVFGIKGNNFPYYITHVYDIYCSKCPKVDKS